MYHVETAQKEMVETVKWHPRKKINCLSPSQIEGLFFILKESHDNIKEMHLL